MQSLFPKLWRRLQGYTRDSEFRPDSDSLDRFIEYLQNRPERVLVIEQGRFTGFDDVVEVDGETVRLLFLPKELVFMS